MNKIFKAVIVIFFMCFIVSTSMSMALQQPDIVFIFADDLGDHDIGVYGNNEVRTPNIDALAEHGVKFTRAYNMGSWSPAVCIPSRTMLNTGRFVWNARELAENDYQSVKVQNEFWSQQLKQAGYSTYFTGKWHVPGVDPVDLFDHVAHVRPGMPNQTKAGYDRPYEDKDDIWSPYDRKFEGFWKGSTHWSEVLADDAVQFIEHASGQEYPFFMYLAFNAPHDPRQSPKEYVDSYDPEKLRIPENFLPLIHNEATQHYPAVYGTYLQKQRAVVEWPYKLILYLDISRIRLFHLINDPYETEDLAENADSEPIIRRLMQRLTELQRETGDELELQTFFPGWM